MKLIGSHTSPFVRRVKMVLEGQDYEYEAINIHDENGLKLITPHSPVAKIPLLIEDDGTAIWDSTVIIRHLSKESWPLEIEKDLCTINELSDTAVKLYQLRDLPAEIQKKHPFFEKQQNRIAHILDYFEAQPEKFKEWNLTSMWLYCTLDWFSFRGVYDWQTDHPHLVDFHQRYCDLEIVKSTAPKL